MKKIVRTFKDVQVTNNMAVDFNRLKIYTLKLSRFYKKTEKVHKSVHLCIDVENFYA